MKKPKWIKRWNYWIAPKPTRQGVWRRKEGGYLIRGKAKDPRTGKQREVKRALPDADAVAAYRILQDELLAIREGRAVEAPTRMSFADYSVSLLERKVRSREIKSVKTRERWKYVLEQHLLPFFGDMFMDQIRRADILRWMDDVAEMIRAEEYSPNTANIWLSTLRGIINSHVHEMELERNPIAGVKDFDASEHHTYTEEQPNSLRPEEVPEFLAKMLELHRRQYAMVALGFATGLRPSSMRPLRRRGPSSDVLWEEGVLLIRRSHTRKQEVMATTKTGQHQRLKLPEELMEILRWHVAELTPKRRQSDLLFPPRWGDGFMSASALDRPFQEVTEALKKEGKLDKKITPRAMRRTFQDLARAAEVKDIVTRAISGHATEGMQRLYSTVATSEIEEAIGKVVSLAKFKEAMTGKESKTGSKGAHRGAHGQKTKKTATQGVPK